MLRWLAIHMHKNEVEPLPHTIYKIKSKVIKDLNVRSKMVKLLEENIWVNFHDLRFGNGFLNKTPKLQATKEKLDELDIIKIKTYVL